MLTFQVHHGREAAKVFAEKLQIIHYAVSLGHHRSLIFYLDSAELKETSFKFATPEQAKSWDLFAGEGIFRMSVGLENAEDLIRDLEQALEACPKAL